MLGSRERSHGDDRRYFLSERTKWSRARLGQGWQMDTHYENVTNKVAVYRLTVCHRCEHK